MDQKSKVDYKKDQKELYWTKQKPTLVTVPKMDFIMVDGKGEPGGDVYQNAMGILYGLNWTIKMSKMGDHKIKGYFEYVIPPLEGLWYGEGKTQLDLNSPRSSWCWTSIIRQPEFVTKEVYDWALQEAVEKKPEIDFNGARFESFEEGLCVQILHLGPYSEEPATIEKLHKFMEQEGLVAATDGRCHHEIYLNDPRKAAPEKWRTILRLPVEYQ